jgi:hypothetical protein
VAQQIVQNGNRAVVITIQGATFTTRLYVNARNGLAGASATLEAKTFKSLKGAQRWADAKVAA